MVWVIRKWRHIRESDSCKAFARGFVEGVVSPGLVWQPPTVSPPAEHAGIEDDWRNVGAYLSHSLRKEREKAQEAA